MAENRLKPPIPAKASQKETGPASSLFSSMLDGTILTKDKVESMLPFFIYMAALALLLIFNTYYAEKKARELERLRTEIVELRLRYVSTKSELMVLSNQSEVARRLKPRGIVESTVPPQKLSKPEKEPHLISRLLNK